MFDQDTLAIILTVTLSVIGLGYCSHGRKHSFYYLIAGLGLLLFPYFVEDFWTSLLIGMILILLPLVLDR